MTSTLLPPWGLDDDETGGQAGPAAVVGVAVVGVGVGVGVELHLERWQGPALAEDLELLELAWGPVLDVGCGPGRHVLALAGRGVATLGLDTCPAAVALARGRGAAVLHRSVFAEVPWLGRWGTALLLDGNVGIGGDPHELLRRLRRLLAPGGRVLVELEAPGVRPVRTRARATLGGSTGPWFPWARVGADAMGDLAEASGFVVTDSWERAGRWFACLDESRHDRPGPAPVEGCRSTEPVDGAGRRSRSTEPVDGAGRRSRDRALT